VTPTLSISTLGRNTPVRTLRAISAPLLEGLDAAVVAVALSEVSGCREALEAVVGLSTGAATPPSPPRFFTVGGKGGVTLHPRRGYLDCLEISPDASGFLAQKPPTREGLER
jgi:hypothetical protein